MQSGRRALRSAQSTLLESSPTSRFFAELRADTLAAVRTDGDAANSRRWRFVRPSGLMTAAALFLLGMYGVSTWLPRGSTIHDLPVLAPSTRPAGNSRIREVGYCPDYYGLLGRFEISARPLDKRVTLEDTLATEPPLDEPAGAGRVSPGPADRQR
jgi:hypothetical protein